MYRRTATSRTPTKSKSGVRVSSGVSSGSSLPSQGVGAIGHPVGNGLAFNRLRAPVLIANSTNSGDRLFSRPKSGACTEIQKAERVRRRWENPAEPKVRKVRRQRSRSRRISLDSARPVTSLVGLGRSTGRRRRPHQSGPVRPLPVECWPVSGRPSDGVAEFRELSWPRDCSRL